MRWDIQILQQFYPLILSSTTDECIHLTFDDGPHPVATPIVLKELKKHNIQATFFLLGQNVQKFPELVRQINDEGHQIGNHSFTHVNLFFKNKAFLRNEMMHTSAIIEEITGRQIKYFRPPYGYFNRSTLKVVQELDLTCVLWSVDSKDYLVISTADILHRVIPITSKGSILLFHDNDLTSERIATYLPIVLNALFRKELVFKTLPI